MTSSRFWPEGHIEMLRELYATNFGSAKQIANELTSRTGTIYGRNSVVGKAWRLGLAKKNEPAGRVKLPIEHPAPVILVPMNGKRLSIMNLQAHHCRYICSDGKDPIYCGNVKFGCSSYCEEHHRICYYRR